MARNSDCHLRNSPVYILAALSGSLISRVEDVPKAQTPMTMIGLLGYMLSVIFASQPDNIVMTVTSYIPFISSFVLPMQIATGVASNLQVWISMGIMFVTMLFILLFSARLYKSNVLIYSSDGLLKVLKQSLNNIKNEDKLKIKLNKNQVSEFRGLVFINSHEYGSHVLIQYHVLYD